jgi:hypothetical protein
MGDSIDTVFQQWQRLGAPVLVAEADHTIAPRPPEVVIAESTALCRASGRLTWVVLDWLIRHIDEIDEQKLIQDTSSRGDLSVLGVLCDAAHQRQPNPKFMRLMQACVPNRQLEAFFYRVAQSPLALRLTQQHPNAVFRRWNYLCNELRYLGSPADEPVRATSEQQNG